MEYQFEKFQNRNVRLENRITITKSNSIGFPSKFYKDNEIRKYKYVVLFYDKKQKAVGIQFMNDEDEKNKFSVIHSKKGYGGSVVVRSFFKTYDIDPKLYYGRYDWKKYTSEETGKLFVIDLKEREVEGEVNQNSK